jgi:hypothetical protein
MITRYVNTASTPGGDGTTNATTGANRAYASLSGFASALPSTLTDSYTCRCTGTDTAGAQFSGKTTTPSNKIIIVADSVGSYSMELTTELAIINYVNHIEFDGIIFKETVSSGTGRLIYCASQTADANLTKFTHCKFIGVLTGTATGLGITHGTNQIIYVGNCVFDGFINGTNDCRATSGDPDDASLYYNNTVINCYKGLCWGYGSGKNNLDASTNNAYTGLGNNNDYNVTSLSSTGQYYTDGAHDHASHTFTFTEAGEFHLASNDAGAIGFGVDLSEDANFPITDDYDYQTRSGAWDCGADQYDTEIQAQTEAATATDTSSAVSDTTAEIQETGNAQDFGSTVGSGTGEIVESGSASDNPSAVCIAVSAIQEPGTAQESGSSTSSGAPVGNSKAIFVHHSTGGYLVTDTTGSDGYGGLGKDLNDAGFYFSTICYGWSAPENAAIGSLTDIGQWYTWFADTTDQNGVARRDRIMGAVFTEYDKDISYGDYTRSLPDPTGENEIVIIKSCFPNADVYDDNDTIPTDLYGHACNYTVGGQYAQTVSNCKALYNQLMTYFKNHTDKIFILMVPPPLVSGSTTPGRAANARLLADWLMDDWREENSWSNQNVFVFDYFNVLTDADNHHRVESGIEVHHTENDSGNYLVYPTGDSHPSGTGQRKAASEFVPLISLWYGAYFGDSTASVTEAGNAQETSSSIYLGTAGISESGNAQDAPSSGYNTLSTISESGNAQEESSAEAISASQALASESGNAQDECSSIYFGTGAIFEAGNAQDIPSASLIAVAGLIEAGNALDLQTASIRISGTGGGGAWIFGSGIIKGVK